MIEWTKDKALRRAFAAECQTYPRQLEEQPRIRGTPSNVLKVWRSRGFLVQLYAPEGPDLPHRLSINRTELKENGAWAEGITWDDLMRLKREAGFGDLCAVEVFPPEGSIVNVANMRHLWLLDETPAYVWRREA